MKALPLLATALSAILTIANGDLLTPLPLRASGFELLYQPLLDFDRDCCYNTAAISPSGQLNNGIGGGNPVTALLLCRSRNRLDNSNVYSRARCNANGWCAIMYVNRSRLNTPDRTISSSARPG